MARIAFLTWAGGGNVPPAIGLAQALAARGHHVSFWGYETQRAQLESRGFPLLSFERSGSFDVHGASREPGFVGLVRHVAACPEHLDDVPVAFARDPVDVLVVDCMMAGALAARVAAPKVVLVHSVIAGLIPPPASPVGAHWLSATNAVRASAGLEPLARIEEAWAGLPTLVTTVPALDPAADAQGPHVRYVGPLAERVRADGWDAPWAEDDPRPLVLVSFSTTGFWDQTGRMRNTLAALADEPVRVLVSGREAASLGPLPPNAVARAFVPHGLVLPGAAATVTHCGHGTLMASLAHGVPLVGLPNQAADQPFLARRLAELGLGLAVDGDADAARIRAAVTSVLADPSYRARARTFAGLIADCAGVEGAASAVERAAS